MHFGYARSAPSGRPFSEGAARAADRASDAPGHHGVVVSSGRRGPGELAGGVLHLPPVTWIGTEEVDARNAYDVNLGQPRWTNVVARAKLRGEAGGRLPGL